LRPDQPLIFLWLQRLNAPGDIQRPFPRFLSPSSWFLIGPHGAQECKASANRTVNRACRSPQRRVESARPAWERKDTRAGLASAIAEAKADAQSDSIASAQTLKSSGMMGQPPAYERGTVSRAFRPG